jgi:hypothetical protein
MVIIRLRKCFYILKELLNILDIPSLKMNCFALVQSILMYGILVWGAAYKNVLEQPLDVTHRTLIRVLMKTHYKLNNITNDLFQKLNIILTLEQLYNHTSIIKVYMNKKVFEFQNTSLMSNHYINRGITLFNQLPVNIKLIDNEILFK